MLFTSMQDRTYIGLHSCAETYVDISSDRNWRSGTNHQARIPRGKQVVWGWDLWLTRTGGALFSFIVAIASYSWCLQACVSMLEKQSLWQFCAQRLSLVTTAKILADTVAPATMMHMVDAKCQCCESNHFCSRWTEARPCRHVCQSGIDLSNIMTDDSNA